MRKVPVRVISDYRVTIPVEFREQYGLEVGDRVWVCVEPVRVGGESVSSV